MSFSSYLYSYKSNRTEIISRSSAAQHMSENNAISAFDLVVSVPLREVRTVRLDCTYFTLTSDISWRSCIGALLLFLRFPDVHRWIFCRILTTEFVAANLKSEIKWLKFACRILYIVFLNRLNILEVNSGRWIWIIEYLIMKMCVKYFELKYSQLK